MSAEFDSPYLSNEEWDLVKNILPGRKGCRGRQAADNRLFLEAVLYRCQKGISWRQLPPCFGDFRKVHVRYSRWKKSGVWQQVMLTLNQDSNTASQAIQTAVQQLCR